jgi:hypothetical protein
MTMEQLDTYTSVYQTVRRGRGGVHFPTVLLFCLSVPVFEKPALVQGFDSGHGLTCFFSPQSAVQRMGGLPLATSHLRRLTKHWEVYVPV